MLTLREGTKKDASLVAQLHALSWKKYYRGILTDDYLDLFVEQDRKSIWEQRFSSSNPDLQVIIAEQNGIPCGFAGLFSNHDKKWGALIDNLHVIGSHQRKGIGTALLYASAEWIARDHHEAPFFLWVFIANHRARKFYEKRGASYGEEKTIENPDGSVAQIIRCYWKNASQLAV